MIDLPRVAWTESALLATIPFTMPPSGVREAVGPAVAELKAVVACQQIQTTAPWCMHYLRLDADVAEFRVCVSVSRPVTPAGRVVEGLWPRTLVARTTHHGSYRELGSAWAAFRGWVRMEQLSAAPGFLEFYVTGPEGRENHRRWQTDLVLPLAG